jgi:hypothetical protein
MLDTTGLNLQLVTDNSESIDPLSNMVAQYTVEIYERRHQLYGDLAYFEAKLADLAQLHPCDFADLAAIYTRHADHIRGLLAEIDQDDYLRVINGTYHFGRQLEGNSTRLQMSV